MKTWQVVLIDQFTDYFEKKKKSQFYTLNTYYVPHALPSLVLKQSGWFWKSKSQFSFPGELFLSNYAVCIWSVVETHSPHELVVQPLSPAGSSPHLLPSHTAERSSRWVPSPGSGGRYQCVLELAPPCDQWLTAAWIYLHKFKCKSVICEHVSWSRGDLLAQHEQILHLPVPLSPIRPYRRPELSSKLVSLSSSCPWKVSDKLLMCTSVLLGWDANTPVTARASVFFSSNSSSSFVKLATPEIRGKKKKHQRWFKWISRRMIKIRFWNTLNKSILHIANGWGKLNKSLKVWLHKH